MCKNFLFDTQIFKNIPIVGGGTPPPTPFPRSVASLPRFGPLLKILAMPVIILLMFALYISR